MGGDDGCEGGGGVQGASSSISAASGGEGVLSVLGGVTPDADHVLTSMARMRDTDRLGLSFIRAALAPTAAYSARSLVGIARASAS